MTKKPILRLLPWLILGGALVWYGALVVRFHSHGALGDDPATYVQMALDLARRGTPTHDFPLLNNLYAQRLSWDAFITPGYHVVRETGAVAPNFAFGLPLLLAGAYRILGEGAFQWAPPLLGACSLVATFALGNLLLSFLPEWKRRTISAFAVLLLATTPKQIQLALVPMSDVPAQLFCVLAAVCALEVIDARVTAQPQPAVPRVPTLQVGARNLSFARLASASPWLFAALGGASLGMAYLMRHSTLVMLLPLAVAARSWGHSAGRRGRLALVALLACICVVLPDALYRANTLGSLFAVESAESTRIDLAAAPRQLVAMGVALLSVTGLGPVALLALVGVWDLVRRAQGAAALVLETWILGFMVFHAPLVLTGVFENNLRYPLPAYPALALLTAVGVVKICEFGGRVVTRDRAQAGIAILGGVVTLALVASALRALVSPERFVARAYGWMSETARLDLERLGAQLPPNAVVGASDQMAGAVMLYVRREVFRPSNFVIPADEFPRFLELMQAQGRPVFLVGDWNCAPTAGDSERLPAWLGEYEIRGWGIEIRDLPYECGQRVWQALTE